MSGVTTIRLPDGSEVDVQTDDPQAAAAAARRHWVSMQSGASTEAAPAPRSALQTAGDFIGDTVDNFLPNWGDEISAIPDAAAALISGKPIGEAFDNGRRQFREHQAQYDEEHPNLAWASTLGGLGASLALPAGRLASGAGMAAKALHGAAVGLGYGAVAGAGEGDDLGQRANNAITGGALGAATGGTMPLVGRALTAGGRLARQVIPGVDGAARRLANVPRSVMRRPLATRDTEARDRTGRFLNSRMSEGNVALGFGQQGAPASPQSLLAEVERRQAIGVPAVLGDVTESMRATTGWASRGSGPGQAMVKAALERRKSDEAMRLRDHISSTLGPVTDPLQQAEVMRARAQAQAAPGYRAAYNTPMVATPEIQAIMETPAFREALPAAVRNIRNAMRSPTELGFRMDEGGNITSWEGLSTEGFDQVIRAMRDSGRAAADKHPITGAPINNTNSIHINARAGDLRNQMAAQNPAYRDVTERFADDMAQRDALLSGQGFGRLTGAELRQVREATPETAYGSWSIGARSAMADAASQFGAKYPTGNTAARVRQMLGDDAKQREVSELTGNTGAVRELQERLEAEHQGNILWSEVNGNSKTAPRQQVDRDAEQALGIVDLPSVTSPIGIATKVANAVQAGVTSGMRRDVKHHVARIVTEADPVRLRQFIEEVSAVAERDREFADRLHSAGLMGAKAAGVNSEAPEPGLYTSNTDRHPLDQWDAETEDGTLAIRLGN